MTGLVLSLALAAADPCAPVGAEGPPDPTAAAAYRSAAEQELAAGNREGAVIAWRAAAGRDPTDGASRAALARACAQAGAHPAGEGAFERGLRLMDGGDCRAAAQAFAAARGESPAGSAALLEGICRYECGDDAAAVRALREAEGHAAHRDEARFYLGLVALRAGDGPLALALFEAAGSDPALAGASADLARRARLEGPWVVALTADSGWDSNVTLAPTGVPAPAPEGGAVYALTGAALFRPPGAGGLYLRGSGFAHNPVDFPAWSVRGLDAAAGWEFRPEAGRLALEYDFAAVSFGAEPYLTAHRLLASGELRLGPARLGATYFARFEDYASAWVGFGGVLHRAEVRAGLAPLPPVALVLAYGLGRDDTRDPVLAYVVHGPRAELRLALARRLAAGLAAAIGWRTYDRLDPALSVRRRDLELAAVAFAELELGGGVRARASLEGRRVVSNAPALEYHKIVPSLGLGYVRGF